MARAAVIAGSVLAVGAITASPALADPGGTDWDAVAQCESGGNWHTNTGNGFSGGLQFTPSTWHAYGGQGAAQNASREQQIAVAERVKQGQGMGAWPVCGHRGGMGRAAAIHRAPVAYTARTPAPENNPVRPIAETRSVPAPVHIDPPEILMGPFLVPVPLGTVAPVQSSYMVTSGDTLTSIARDQDISGGWRAIADANRPTVSDPNVITPDQVLILPAR